MFATDSCIDTTLKNEKVKKYEIVKYWIEKLKPRKVLEIGCGGGTFIRTYANISKFVDIKFVGEDCSISSIDFAKRNNVLPNLTFTDNLREVHDYDFVFLLDVLEHDFYPNSLLKKIRDVTNNKAIVIIHVPLEKSGIYNIHRFRDIKSIYSDHMYFFNSKDIEGLVEHNKFTIIQKYYHYHFISGFRDFLKYYLLHKRNISNNRKDLFYTKDWQVITKWSLILKTLDWLSYYETKFLHWMKFGASGVTLVCVKNYD